MVLSDLNINTLYRQIVYSCYNKEDSKIVFNQL